VWGEVYGRLRQRGIPVVAVDLPGHGRHPDPAPATVEERADAVERILAEAEVRSYVVAGHSLGGAVALTLAVRQAAGLGGIAAVSTGARLPVDPMVLRGAREAFACTVEHLAKFLFARAAPPEQVREAAGVLTRGGPETLYADFAACSAYQLEAEALAGVRVPAEVVCGDADVLTPLALSEELAAVLPLARITRLSGVGHMPLLIWLTLSREAEHPFPKFWVLVLLLLQGMSRSGADCATVDHADIRGLGTA
jgi:pimeloyl-ACP methyl ester carboxylesterase